MKYVGIFIALILIACCITPVTAGWYNTSWYNRQQHYITLASGSLTDYTIPIIIRNDSGTSSGNTVYCDAILNDFDDLRFTASDGTTELPYWIEWTNATSAYTWVTVPSLSSNTSIYIYYNYSSASAVSNGYNTFAMFDDFDTGKLFPFTKNSVAITSGTHLHPSTLGVYEPSNSVEYRLFFDDGPINHNLKYYNMSNEITQNGAAIDTGIDGVWGTVYKPGINASYVRISYMDYADSSGNTNARVAESITNGVTWVDEGQTITKGSAGAWDDYLICDPSELYLDNGTYVMFYDGRTDVDSTDNSIGIALSTTGQAGSYTKFGSNPVFTPGASGSFDDSGVFDPRPYKFNSTHYILFYSGIDGLISNLGAGAYTTSQFQGYAWSTDLITWTRGNGGAPINWRTESYESAYGGNELDVIWNTTDDKLHGWWRAKTDTTSDSVIGYLNYTLDSNNLPDTVNDGQWFLADTGWTESGGQAHQGTATGSKVLLGNYYQHFYSDYYAETKWQIPHSTINGNFMYRYGDNITSYASGHWYESGPEGVPANFYIAEQTPWASLVNLADATSESTWYKTVVRAQGSSLKATKHTPGEEPPTSWDLSTTDASNAKGTIGFYDFNSKFDIEYVFIHPAASTEPVHGVYGSEQSYAPPTANFTANVTSGMYNLPVLFTDTSTGTPTSWSWTFGDGNTSTSQNPTFTYTYSGTFTVNLTATNSISSDTESKSGYITVSSPTPTPTPTPTTPPTTTIPTTSPTTAPTTPPPTGTPSPGGWGGFTSCSNVTTNAASGLGENSATLNGNYTGSAGEKLWFRYGSVSGSLPLSTTTQNATSSPMNFTFYIHGPPLYPGHTYYYRACSECGCGNETSFTLPGATTTLSTVDTQYYDSFVSAAEDDFNMSGMIDVGISAYTDIMGNMFFGLILMFLFVGIFMRQGVPVIPAVLAILGTTIISPLLPADWGYFAQAAIAIVIGLVLYYIIRGRKND
jgi:PKD repeat protein